MPIDSQLKERLIGGSIIVALACGLVFTLNRKPTEVIKEVIREVVKTEVKVETKIEYVDRVVDNNIVTHRVIKEEPDGTKITEETISDTSQIDESSRTSDQSTVATTEIVKEDIKETTKYQKDNFATVVYDVPFSNPSVTLDPTNTQIFVGQRLFSLPLFLTVGTNGKFNQVSAGLTFEF